MSDMDSGNIEVSKEEERYLRRAFRRFALPYVVAGVVLVGIWGAVNGFQVGPAHDPGEAPEIQGLIAESASLRQAIVALRTHVDEAAARAEEGVTRISSLEKRVAQVSDATEAASSRASGTAQLRKRLEEAHQRINALDARLAAVSAATQTNTMEREQSVRRMAPPASSGTASGGWEAEPLPR
jgi:prophage DNA circulation protein